MRNIASDKTIIMKNMTKNQGIIFPPEENKFLNVQQVFFVNSKIKCKKMTKYLCKVL